MCYAYAYDTLIRPHPPKEVASFGHVIDLKRIKKAGHSLTHDFIRASLNPKDVSYLVMMCVEAGGVMKPKTGTRNCMSIMWYWLQKRFLALGDIDQIHFFHSGGLAPEEPETPVVVAPTTPLRIRIPKRRNSIT
jgi:hypothetical protein